MVTGNHLDFFLRKLRQPKLDTVPLEENCWESSTFDNYRRVETFMCIQIINHWPTLSIAIQTSIYAPREVKHANVIYFWIYYRHLPCQRSANSAADALSRLTINNALKENQGFDYELLSEVQAKTLETPNIKRRDNTVQFKELYHGRNKTGLVRCFYWQSKTIWTRGV